MDALRKDYRVSAICQAVDMARSSYYRKPVERAGVHRIEAAIACVAGAHPSYGSRRISAQLRRAPYKLVVNRKQAQRVMRRRGLLAKPRRTKVSARDSRHGFPRFPNLLKSLPVTRPNQVWVADIAYIPLESDYAHLSLLMDLYTRNIRGWQLSSALGQELTLAALTKALQQHPPPEIHHSDQGAQYVGSRYVGCLQQHDVRISMSAAGKPSENGYAERVIRTIKEEEVYLNEYRNIDEARREIGHFIDVFYTHDRIHSALDYIPPAEFEAEWNQFSP